MANKQHKEVKAATSRVVEVYYDGQGKRHLRKQVAGHPDAVAAALAWERARYGSANVQEVKEDSASGFWAGFGSGKMDASRGAKTKRVFVRGQGWVDVSLN